MFDGLERLIYQPGEQIFKEGDEGCCAYLIESGGVDVSVYRENKPFSISTLGNGELFGEVALIDNKPRTATVTALEETRVVRINRELIDAKLANHDPIIEHLLRLVLKRFRDTHYRLIGKEKVIETDVDNDVDKAFSDTQQNLIEHIRIASDIHDALINDEFKLYYQPIISIKDEQLVGFEALIRWAHPEKGIVSPLDFISIAESTDQIIPLGNWTLEQACTDITKLNKIVENKLIHIPLFVSVNVSARQLSKSNDTDEFKNIINIAGVSTKFIKLEVTETLMIDEPEYAEQILTSLKNIGFKLSLDDFGTGYSSLSHLQKFPVDNIKIDRSFISRMLSDNGSMQIVKASIDLARAMGMEVIAEGVETREELEKLAEMNCNYIQSFHYS